MWCGSPVASGGLFRPVYILLATCLYHVGNLLTIPPGLTSTITVRPHSQWKMMLVSFMSSPSDSVS